MASTSKNTNRTNRKLTFQTLESRQLMAGNVTAAVVNGDLKITGNAKDNDVAIFQVMQQGQVVPGRYLVSGLNGTTINGDINGFNATGVNRDFLIDMTQGGNDHVAIGNMNPSNPNLTNASFVVPRNLNVSLDIAGNNNLEVKGITVRNNAAITAGRGNNTFSIRGDFGVPIKLLGRTVSLLGISHGDLSIQAGGGNNELNMFNSSVLHNLGVQMGLGWSGSDTVNMDQVTVHGSMGLRTGGIGGDRLNFVTLNHVNVDHTLSLGGGVDHGYWWIQNSHVDSLIAALAGHGPHGNSLWLDHVDGRQATLDGGPSGHNELYTREANFTNEQITRFQTQGPFTG